ncbi:MAG: phospholipase A [SAR324 cluster bacterium]|nr:phospholipase A [SAR324 cluster bacterium]
MYLPKQTRLTSIFMFSLMLMGVTFASPAFSQSSAQTSAPITDENIFDAMNLQISDLKETIVDLQEKLAQSKETGEESKNFKIYSHKPNYILPGTWTVPSENRMQQEIQFQLSFRQQLFEHGDFRFFYSYSQKSFFQFYDGKNSRPFRETNYNPEIFVRTPNYRIENWGIWQFDLGYEHESNGQRIPVSRSWDRTILRLFVVHDLLTLRYKIWYRFPESRDKPIDDPARDDNPDIEEYYGKSQLTIQWEWNDFRISLMGRYAVREKRGGLEANLSFPIAGNGKMKGLIQYWDGYGESLIDYNRHINKIGIGVILAEGKIL